MTQFEEFQTEADDGQEWEIDFSDGATRTTTLAWIAYRAHEDDDAEVSRL